MKSFTEEEKLIKEIQTLIEGKQVLIPIHPGIKLAFSVYWEDDVCCDARIVLVSKNPSKIMKYVVDEILKFTDEFVEDLHFTDLAMELPAAKLLMKEWNSRIEKTCEKLNEFPDNEANFLLSEAKKRC